MVLITIIALKEAGEGKGKSLLIKISPCQG